jgi:hypothetical protein
MRQNSGPILEPS